MKNPINRDPILTKERFIHAKLFL